MQGNNLEMALPCPQISPNELAFLGSHTSTVG